jgi:hypothetical protein
MRTMAIGDVRP